MTFRLELSPAELVDLSIVTGEYILHPDIADIPYSALETVKGVDLKLKHLLKEWERETITIPRSALVKVLDNIQDGYEEYTATLQSGGRFEDAMNEAWDLLKKGEE